MKIRLILVPFTVQRQWANKLTIRKMVDYVQNGVQTLNPKP